jgi:hypothetical protein
MTGDDESFAAIWQRAGGRPRIPPVRRDAAAAASTPTAAMIRAAALLALGENAML